MASSSDETESSNPLGQLIFEYFEHETPYNREPLTDKIADLAWQFPELKTYQRCDHSPVSWVSLPWHRASIVRVFFESGPSIDGFHMHHSRGRDISSKLSLPVSGLAFHKFNVSVWDPDGGPEGGKANSLFRAADYDYFYVPSFILKMIQFSLNY